MQHVQKQQDLQGVASELEVDFCRKHMDSKLCKAAQCDIQIELSHLQGGI